VSVGAKSKEAYFLREYHDFVVCDRQWVWYQSSFLKIMKRCYWFLLVF